MALQRRFLTSLWILILTGWTGTVFADSRPLSRGNSFNPDISINTLFLYQNSSRGNAAAADSPNGFSLQEAEIQFTSDVDPYFRFAALFAVHPHKDTDPEPGHTAATHYHFEPEEIYAETLSLPWVTFKIGKFKTAFGRHNLLHTHAYPFIDAPLAHQEFLGEEGMNDTGLSAALFLPTPWFSELTAQALSGDQLHAFGSENPNTTVSLIHFKNLIEITDAATVQLGLSGAIGKNEFRRETRLAGADLTFKWRPIVYGNTRSLSWSTELLSRETQTLTSTLRENGWVSFLQYQLAQRWWLQGRAEQVSTRELLFTERAVTHKQSALVAFLPSEFSGIRFQYDHLKDERDFVEHKLSLQMNFSIGAHPAHLY